MSVAMTLINIWFLKELPTEQFKKEVYYKIKL